MGNVCIQCNVGTQRGKVLQPETKQTCFKWKRIVYFIDCPDYKFRCDNGQCINSSNEECNGYTDCPDGSDEDDCSDFGK